MRTSAADSRAVSAVRVRIAGQAVVVELSDGRTISAPLAWYPRLLHGNPRERRNWRLIARGDGIHWPDLDEDVSVTGILAGRPSRESQASLEKWLAARGAVATRKRAQSPRTRTQGVRRRARG